MKKQILLLTTFVFMFCASAQAQPGPVNTTAQAVKSVGSLPATCAHQLNGRVNVIYKTGATAGFYTCRSTGNAWDGPYPTSAGGLGTVTTSGSPASPQLAKFSSSTAITTATATDVSTPLITTDSGSDDTYVGNPAPSIASYTSKLTLLFTPNTSNTGAATINVNGLGAKDIKKMVGVAVSDPADGDMRAGKPYILTYDGTQFLIMSTLGNAAASGSTINATDNVLPQRADALSFTNSPITGSVPGSMVDGFTLTGAATASPATVTMAATGSDSNIHFKFQRKGTSNFWFDQPDANAKVVFGSTNSTSSSSNNAWIEFVGSAFVRMVFDRTGEQSVVAGDGINTPRLTSKQYFSEFNCADSAGAAACSAAVAGSFVIDAASTSVVVSASNVTANSQIIVVQDSSLGTRLSVTCNTTPNLPLITARTANTSFTVTVAAAPITNPACFNYLIIN